MLRQVPCWQRTSGNPPNSFTHMCYSDIPVLFMNRPYLWGNGPIIGDGNPDQPWFEYPPLTTAFVWLSRVLARAFGGLLGTGFSNGQSDGQLIVDSANIFWSVNTLMLAMCFALLLWAHLQMGRDSASVYTDGIRLRAWDALYIAASPVIMLSGLVNWDMFAVALTSLGLLMWAKSRPWAAGAVIGLAAATKFYPLAIVGVLLILCVRAGAMKAWGRFMAGVFLAWLVVNLPLMVTNHDAWAYFWAFNESRGPDLGSLWYVLTLMGAQIANVSVLEMVALVFSSGVIIALTLSAPRRPRVGQVALLVMVAFLAFNKVYSPQYVLWLLPVVVLARPVLFDLLVFTISESLYFFAVWGFLGTIMPLGSGTDRLYWLATFLRIGVQLWLAGRVIRDMWAPWQDPVRAPFIDDPIGGVLKHAPDTGWLLRRGTGDVPPAPARRAGLMEESPEPGKITVVLTPNRLAMARRRAV